MDQTDKLDYDINFLSGICCLCESDYEQARHFFFLAVYDNFLLGKNYAVYKSYLGLSGVLIDYKDDILNHCYHSTDASIANEPEVQLNLACAEFIKGDRKRAFQAIDKLNNLNLSTNCREEIHSLFDIVGTRKKNNSGSLKRNNFIYKSIGKIFRKKGNTTTPGHIETFIKETARNRYECDLHSIWNNISIEDSRHTECPFEIA